MDPQSPNKLIVTKYCFLILGDDTSFFLFLLLLLLFYVIINLKIYIFYFFIFFLYFFYEFFFYFFMFRDVPACSGMFHVPGFIDGHAKELKRLL